MHKHFFAKQQSSPNCVSYCMWAKNYKFQTGESLIKDLKRALNISSCLLSLLLQALILPLTLVGVTCSFCIMMQAQLHNPVRIMAAFILYVLGNQQRTTFQCLTETLTKEWLCTLFRSFAVTHHDFLCCLWFYAFYP